MKSEGTKLAQVSNAGRGSAACDYTTDFFRTGVGLRSIDGDHESSDNDKRLEIFRVEKNRATHNG